MLQSLGVEEAKVHWKKVVFESYLTVCLSKWGWFREPRT